MCNIICIFLLAIDFLDEPESCSTPIKEPSPLEVSALDCNSLDSSVCSYILTCVYELIWITSKLHKEWLFLGILMFTVHQWLVARYWVTNFLTRYTYSCLVNWNFVPTLFYQYITHCNCRWQLMSSLGIRKSKIIAIYVPIVVQRRKNAIVVTQSIVLI